MNRYYSQNGEDFILDKLLEGRNTGFFVEAGSLDGRRFSNTLTFEERGWKGLCIEAHSGYIELLKQNRPNSIVCHCAVGETDQDDVTFYSNLRGSLSTLDSSREHHFRENFGEYFSGFEEQLVDKRRLDTLFHDNHVPEIDILSLDVEGYEIEALKGIDFRNYRPLIIVVESDSPEHELQLDNLLLPEGYVKSVTLATNVFYLLDPSMEQRILNKRFNVELIHTLHPVDQGKDIVVSKVIDTSIRKVNVFPRMNFNVLKKHIQRMASALFGSQSN